MRDELEKFERHGAKLLAVDPHESWSAKYLLKEVGFGPEDVRYPLLMDPTQTVSAMYGVAFQMRIHVEWSNRPATFVIDRGGVIRYARWGKSFADRPRAAEVVRELEKLELEAASGD